MPTGGQITRQRITTLLSEMGMGEDEDSKSRFDRDLREEKSEYTVPERGE